MSLNTYPCSPFPPSTADMEKGDVTEQQKALIATIPGKAQKADIAPEFSAENAYSAGDLVYYNGALYEFTADHAAGAWSTDDTQAATIGGELDQLKSGLTNYQTQNDINLEVPNRKNLLNLKELKGTGATTVNVADDTATIHGTVSWSSCNDGSGNNLKYKAGKYYVKFNVVSATDYSFIMAGFRKGNNQFIGSTISVTESGQYSGVIETSESSFFSIVINDDTPVDNTAVIEDIMISPYDEAYTPYIPSVESRIEAVESGLTNVNNKFGGVYFLNTSIAVAGSKDINTTALSKFMVITSNNTTGRGLYICYSDGSNNVNSEAILSASGLTLTAGSGKITIANGSTASEREVQVAILVMIGDLTIS